MLFQVILMDTISSMRRLALFTVVLPFLALLSMVALSTGMGVWSRASAASTAQTSGHTTSGSNPSNPSNPSRPAAGPSTLAGVPAGMLALYRSAAATCPGLSWSVLAGIGTVESSNGTSDLPGVHSGANFAGAEGPMQFEPATFADYAYPVPPGGANPPNPYDAADAVYAAARDLCANGGESPSGLPGAIFAYNHASWYVSEVLALAATYAKAAHPTPMYG